MNHKPHIKHEPHMKPTCSTEPRSGPSNDFKVHIGSSWDVLEVSFEDLPPPLHVWVGHNNMST